MDLDRDGYIIDCACIGAMLRFRSRSNESLCKAAFSILDRGSESLCKVAFSILDRGKDRYIDCADFAAATRKIARRERAEFAPDGRLSWPSLTLMVGNPQP